ncbi:hypothetical protein SprV_0702454700 [Sparganum proliferum]
MGLTVNVSWLAVQLLISLEIYRFTTRVIACKPSVEKSSNEIKPFGELPANAHQRPHNAINQRELVCPRSSIQRHIGEGGGIMAAKDDGNTDLSPFGPPTSDPGASEPPAIASHASSKAESEAGHARPPSPTSQSLGSWPAHYGRCVPAGCRSAWL